MKPTFDKRTYMRIKGCRTPQQMYDFLYQIYMAGFKDGAGTELDPDQYYICGGCGGELNKTVEARYCYHCGARLDFSELLDAE